jgi:hypothetical protein
VDFFDRIRADLAADRLRRLAELAVKRGWLPADRALGGGPPERALAEAGLRPSQVDELIRALDAAPLRSPIDGGVGGPSASRYELGERLGEGAVAVVYRGTDRELGRPVALKFMREGVLADEKARERFRREAQSLARSGQGREGGPGGSPGRPHGRRLRGRRLSQGIGRPLTPPLQLPLGRAQPEQADEEAHEHEQPGPVPRLQVGHPPSPTNVPRPGRFTARGKRDDP